MTDLRMRHALTDDLDAVLAFWKTAAEGTSISDDRDGVERLAARDPEALILAELDGELVGTVIAGFDGWRCHLYRLAVHPGRQPAGHRLGAAGGRRGAVRPARRPHVRTRWCWCATRPPTMPGAPPGTSRRSSGDAG